MQKHNNREFALVNPMYSNNCWSNAVIEIISLFDEDVWEKMIHGAISIDNITTRAAFIKLCHLAESAKQEPNNESISNEIRQIFDTHIYPYVMGDVTGGQRDAVECIYRLCVLMHSVGSALFRSECLPQVACSVPTCGLISEKDKQFATVMLSDICSEDASLFDSGIRTLQGNFTYFECQCGSRTSITKPAKDLKLAQYMVFLFEKERNPPIVSTVTVCDITFSLIGVVCHFGESRTSGHYVTYSYVNGIWRKHDGKIVSSPPSESSIILATYKQKAAPDVPQKPLDILTENLFVANSCSATYAIAESNNLNDTVKAKAPTADSQFHVESLIDDNNNERKSCPYLSTLGVFIHFNSPKCLIATQSNTEPGTCRLCGNTEENLYNCENHPSQCLCPQCFKDLNTTFKVYGEHQFISLRDFFHYVIDSHSWWNDTLVSLMMLDASVWQHCNQHLLDLIDILPCTRFTDSVINRTRYFKINKRFMIQAYGTGSHFMLLLIGREHCKQFDHYSCWYFDSFNHVIGLKMKEWLGACGCETIVRIECPEQSDGYNCGPLTAQNFGRVLNVLNDNADAPLAEFTQKLTDRFMDQGVDAATIREKALELYLTHSGVRNSLESLCQRSQKHGTNEVSGRIRQLLLGSATQFNSSVSSNLLSATSLIHDPVSFTQNPLSVNNGSLRGIGNMEDYDAEDILDQARTYAIQPTGPAMQFPKTKSPAPNETSSTCLGILIECLTSFPVGVYVPSVNALCTGYPDWRRCLTEKDHENLALAIVTIMEQKTGHWAKWSFKSKGDPCVSAPGGNRYRLSCSSRGRPKAKPPIAGEGKKQRDRESDKCNCPQTAVLSAGFSLGNKPHTCPQRQPIDQLQCSRIVRATYYSHEDEERFFENLKGIYSVQPNPSFVKDYIRIHRPETDHLIVNRYIARLKLLFSANDVDISELRTHLDRNGIYDMNFEAIKDTGGKRLSAVAWREDSWHHPQEFNIFLIDGAAKMVCREYTAMPILGVTQELAVELVAMILCDSESAASVRLGLGILAKADTKLWERATFWMSDESGGIDCALTGRSLAYHRFCRLHKAANFHKNYNERGDVALVEDEDMTKATEALIREIDAANMILEKEKMENGTIKDRMKYILNSFSRISDCYVSPNAQDSSEVDYSSNWFNFMRTAPTEEHLLRRLGEFASNAGRLKYALYLWRSRNRWALCSMPVMPEFGIGTNNHTEAFISTMRKGIRPNVDLRQFAIEIGALVKETGMYQGVTAAMLRNDGRNSKPIASLEERLGSSNAVPTLVRHMKKLNVSSFGRRTLLENVDEARGLDAAIRDLKYRPLTEQEVKDLALHSSFGIRFLKLLDIFEAGESIGRVIQIIETRPVFKSKPNKLSFFVMVCKSGSYACSCGYPEYFGGIMCPHLIASFEAGLISFHALFNLHPFYILPANGSLVDFSARASVPLLSVICAAVHKKQQPGIILVTEQAQWSIAQGFPEIDEAVSIKYILSRRLIKMHHLEQDTLGVNDADQPTKSPLEFSNVNAFDYEFSNDFPSQHSNSNTPEQQTANHEEHSSEHLSKSIRLISPQFEESDMQVDKGDPDQLHNLGRIGAHGEEAYNGGERVFDADRHEFKPYTYTDPMKPIKTLRYALNEHRSKKDFLDLATKRICEFLDKDPKLVKASHGVVQTLIEECSQTRPDVLETNLVVPFLNEYRALKAEVALKASANPSNEFPSAKKRYTRTHQSKSSPISRFVAANRELSHHLYEIGQSPSSTSKDNVGPQSRTTNSREPVSAPSTITKKSKAANANTRSRVIGESARPHKVIHADTRRSQRKGALESNSAGHYAKLNTQGKT